MTNVDQAAYVVGGEDVRVAAEVARRLRLRLLARDLRELVLAEPEQRRLDLVARAAAVEVERVRVEQFHLELAGGVIAQVQPGADDATIAALERNAAAMVPVTSQIVDGAGLH